MLVSMSGDPVIYFNRYTEQFEREPIYGEEALRFICLNPLGRLLARCLVARPFFSRFFGWYMSLPGSTSRIRGFIEEFRIDSSEFRKPLDSYTSFNDFFRRELKTGVRPVDPDPLGVVFPADGRHLGWERLGLEQGLFLKGQRWNLPDLLGGDTGQIQRFSGGGAVLSRLCPTDYHRFHFPVAGRMGPVRLLPGPLYSVNPLALRTRIRTLWENRRLVSLLEDTPVGTVAMIEVGATNVGSIRHEHLEPGQPVQRGQAKGWFEFGGSAIVTLFEPGRVRLSEDLLRHTREQIELYARMGDRMGVLAETPVPKGRP